MSTQIQRRRGTTAEHSTFTGVEGELTVDTTKDTVVVHDGATTGGRPLLREDQTNLPTSVTNGISVPSANNVAISTNGTGRLFVDSSGNVGVGTASPASRLHIRESFNATSIPLRVYGSATGTGGASYDIAHFLSEDATTVRISEYNAGLASMIGELTLSAGDLNTQVIGSTGPLVFKTNVANETKGYLTSNERARIDSSGRLLVGTSSTSNTNLRAIFQGTPAAATGTGYVYLSMGRNNPTSGQELGAVAFSDNGHSASVKVAAICDGGWTTGTDQPSALVFSTTADGASSPTERMRITSGGAVLIGSVTNDLTNNGFFSQPISNDYYLGITNNSGTSAVRVLNVNRQASDGSLVDFRQADTLEGTISVSGTTVSYNGGHLSRWSQLSSNEDPSGILKGTVMSNLDEMCEWGEEDNEQLNKTKISDVEGDKNVAGVFVATSFSDDGPLDFFVGMTGDMVIRIAEGVIVERGDLLMSAGDGTAKPQDDDIIRSKTIAKVTSTNVSCTYDDGSYCVPCVLMAC